MGAISELYRGRISAPTEITVNAEEHDRLIDRAEEQSTALKKCLTADALEFFDDLLDIQQQLTAIASEDSYTKGFRDGAAIMLDMLSRGRVLNKD